MHVPNEMRTVTVRNIKTIKLCIINHISVYQQMREGGGCKQIDINDYKLDFILTWLETTRWLKFQSEETCISMTNHCNFTVINVKHCQN